jgi:ferredoxin
MKNDNGNTRITQGVKIYRNICTRSKSPKASCDTCVKACPVGAISFNPSLDVQNQCIGCGICTAACPNGVFELVDRDDESLCLEIDKILTQTGSDNVTFVCGDKTNRNPAEISVVCLAGLNESVLLSAFNYGAEKVALHHFKCNECLLYSKFCNVYDLCRKMDVFMRLTGIDTGRFEVTQIHSAPSYPSGQPHKKPQRELSRRDFFSLLKRTARSRFDDFSDDSDNEEYKKCRAVNNKRQRLLNILARFDKLVSCKIDNNRVPFADIRISDSCVGCGVCQKTCPVGALKNTTHNGNFSLDFSPDICTSCRLCEELCARRAIRINNSFDLGELLSMSDKKLIELQGKSCELCGHPFYGTDGDVCFVCSGRPQHMGLHPTLGKAEWKGGGSH